MHTVWIYSRAPGASRGFRFGLREPVDASKTGKPAHPEPGDGDAREAADDDGGLETPPRRSHARLELAEFVRGADEDGIHGAHAAADAVRRLELNQHVADIDAHHVR